MATSNLHELMQHLTTGLEVLQDDYAQLFEQHAVLEHKLARAREQYNELAKSYGKTAFDTPPLSLASASLSAKKDEDRPLSACQILHVRRNDQAARQLRIANDASQRLLAEMKSSTGMDSNVKIWSGPSADNSRLPSITESPMEQDFTIPGIPSKLGCPFASMTGRKLSSHAASVLSRYHGSQRDGKNSSRERASLHESTDSRVLSGGSSVQHRTPKRRSSLVDPIKAEICGLDSHDVPVLEKLQTEVEEVPGSAADAGVCPIRFLNRHSPEELATYFERHKHELPRSHEVCVRRYQSNEEQVRELDARYGDVAQMIRGLGEKHQSFLPKDPEDEHEDDAVEHTPEDGARVQQWADHIETQPRDAVAQNDHKQDIDATEDDIRQSHFTRPLRDIRVGESPSRPWGISIPAQYLERNGSDASSVPAQINVPQPTTAEHDVEPVKKPSGCPFAAMRAAQPGNTGANLQTAPQLPEGHPPVAAPHSEASPVVEETAGMRPSNIFNGPIIVGYGPEDAAIFLKKLGYQDQ